jgi:hypothetical protein
LKVIPLPGSIITAIRNKNDDDLTESPIPFGKEIHDSAVLNPTSPVSATDTVTYQRFSSIDCTGVSTTETYPINGDGTIADSKPFILTIASQLVSYKAIYNNPSGNLVSPCLSLQTSITSMEVRDSRSNSIISGTTVDPGIPVHESTTIRGPVDTSTGTITYQTFNSNDCTNLINQEKIAINTVGSIPDSTSIVVQMGDFSYRAVYIDDAGTHAR